jgi:hypothetical protein
VLRVEVCEHDVASALIISRRITEEEALRPALIERELALVVADCAASWLRRLPSYHGKFNRDARKIPKT